MTAGPRPRRPGCRAGRRRGAGVWRWIFSWGRQEGVRGEAGTELVEFGAPVGTPPATLRIVDPGAVQAVAHEAAQLVEPEAEVAHHHPPGPGGRDLVQGRIVGVRVDAQ